MIIRPWRARPPAVRTVLLLVLAVPMLVVIAITANETLEAGDRADRSLSVVETAGTLEELVELRAALAAEQRWTAVVVKLNELGIDTSAAAVVLGLDPIDEVQRVTSEVDARVPMLDDPAFAARLAGLRQGTFELSVGLAASGAGYSMLASDLASSIDLHLASLADDSNAGLSGVQQAGTLADAAARWDLAQADQLWGWMGVAAGFVGGEEDPLGLLADANTREAVYAAEVERALPAEGAVRDLWLNDPTLDQVGALQEIYRDRVDATLNSGAAQPEGDLVALLSNMDEFLSVSGLAATSSTHSSAVVSAALDDVAATAHAERDAALASRNRLLVFATLVVTALGLIVVAVSRTVIRPLAQMAQVAAALQEGSLDERVEVAGPRETRVAALALNNAVDQLKLAEQQALALADERLDDPVFDASVPGLLGASLRRSVSHLHESLSDRDDYRRRLQHEAAHDSLTQLPNRKATLTYLEGALSRGERSGQPVAALFVDIDFFKDVNDRYGHAVGDQLLTVVARRLRGAARGGDLVGRIGGDEFLVVVEQVLDPEALTTIASRLLALVSQPVELDELVIQPSATIGIAISSPQIPTAEGLVRAADLALYQAKEAGRGGFEICDEELRDVLAARAEVTDALGDAIDRDELVLHYQPVVDAQTRLITGAEALVRWERPGVGLVQPDQFVPIAERGDLILRLDRWVLRAAARQLAVWMADPDMKLLDLAVNVSGRHLSSRTFVSDVLEPLREFGVPPAKMVLEITESALVEDLDAAAVRLHELKGAGCRVALDDFGTGFASLAHLRSLPIDILKIDRIFVNELRPDHSHPFVSLVVDTGRLLGVRVVGEGVETAQQADTLSELGCELLQGFYFGRPGPVDQLSAAVKDHDVRTAIF